MKRTPQWEARARAWLRRNPRPKDFKGTELQWAELNMPAMPDWLCKLLGVRP